MNKNKVEHINISDAMKILTTAIGIYGSRRDIPITIEWGNGIILSEDGIELADGHAECVDAIYNFDSNMSLSEIDHLKLENQKLKEMIHLLNEKLEAVDILIHGLE